MPKAEAQLHRRSSSPPTAASATTGSSAAATSSAGCMATTRAREHRRSHAIPARQHRRHSSPPVSGRGPGTNASRAWDLDEMMFDSHGNLGVDGRLPTDRPHVVEGVRLVPVQASARTSALNFYGGSGTPDQQVGPDRLRACPVLVEGRGSLGRTDALTQTDLLVSHDFRLGGGTSACGSSSTG